ncbi:unnamed protein product [Trifolium pratense]|uniref:Uncharacterized protein n=1 Tax=Trifolium pratense TaxID=57577 RepID=A0ACB0IPD2_TRIPR|nr:unnamed protein product [Trifolium pratense]
MANHIDLLPEDILLKMVVEKVATSSFVNFFNMQATDTRFRKLSNNPDVLKKVMSILTFIGLIFIPIGIAALIASNNVVEISLRYDDICLPSTNYNHDDALTYIKDDKMDKTCFKHLNLFRKQKTVVLSTATWMGGKNNFLGIGYIAIGGFCLMFTLFYGVMCVMIPEPLGRKELIHLTQAKF